MHRIEDLKNCDEMEIHNWTEDFDVYEAKSALLALLEHLELKLIVQKDDYGNVRYRYEKI